MLNSIVHNTLSGDMEEMKQELKEMMNETQDVKVKEAIQKVLNEMNK